MKVTNGTGIARGPDERNTMDVFVRETLTRQRMASLLAEADRDRLARAYLAEQRKLRSPWHRRLLTSLRGRVVAAAHVALDAAGQTRPTRPTRPRSVRG
jgi:hypothetical protein